MRYRCPYCRVITSVTKPDLYRCTSCNKTFRVVNNNGRGNPAPPKVKREPNIQGEQTVIWRILKEILNEIKEIEEAIEQGIPHNEKYLGILRTRVQRLKEELRIEEE